MAAFDVAQRAVAYVADCPRCALGRQAWYEFESDHFYGNALALAAPFMAIVLLVTALEPLSGWREVRRQRRAASDEVVR